MRALIIYAGLFCIFWALLTIFFLCISVLMGSDLGVLPS